MILYEYPFNERVRAYLRLEYLFDRLFFFSREQDLRHHQIAVTTLFDIVDLVDRTDVRTALIHDLERQRTQLIGLRDHPEVDSRLVDQLLAELAPVAAAIGASSKSGQMLRTNEWLTSLRGRVAVPGGASQVDMPSYHAWQHRSIEMRQTDLQNWVQPLVPLFDGSAIVLRLLRDSGSVADRVAENGTFQQMQGGRTFQLMRVWVDPHAAVFPEISGNKHMIGIRFFEQFADVKPQSTAQRVPFQLALCSI